MEYHRGTLQSEDRDDLSNMTYLHFLGCCIKRSSHGADKGVGKLAHVFSANRAAVPRRHDGTGDGLAVGGSHLGSDERDEVLRSAT